MSGIVLRDHDRQDDDLLLALNQANVPEVGDLTAAQFAALIPMQAFLRVAWLDGAPVAALFLMNPGESYQSSNYRWFCERFEAFLYIDRIMVAATARRRGVGRALYDDAVALARAADAPRLLAEVNTDPPNPGSLAFHARFGFVQLEERAGDDGKRVMMLEKLLGAG